jgi:hypothetical protein
MFIARFPNLSIAIALPNLNIGIARLSSAILFSYSSSEADDDTPRIINTGPRPGKYRYRRSLPDVPPHVEYDSDKFENEKEDYDIDNILDKDNEKNSDERTVPMPRFGRYITEEEYENKIADDKRAMPMLRLGHHS